jgi:hypothetical protein
MAPSGIPGNLPVVLYPYQAWGSAWWAEFFPHTHGTKIEKLMTDPEPKECPLTGDSSYGDLPCLEALQRATGQNPSVLGIGETLGSQGEHLPSSSNNTGNLEVVTEKVGTLDLQCVEKNHSGGIKKRARGARWAGAPTGESTCDQPLLRGCQTQTLQQSSTSELQSKRKHLRSSGTMPESGQAKRSRSSGQPSYARAAQGGLKMAIICDGYPKVEVSKDDFVKIQWATGGLLDGLPE